MYKLLLYKGIYSIVMQAESFSRCPSVETYESIDIKVPFEVVWDQQWLFSLCSPLGWHHALHLESSISLFSGLSLFLVTIIFCPILFLSLFAGNPGCLIEYVISVYYQHRIMFLHDLILSETINVPPLTFILTEICDLPFNNERCLGLIAMPRT